MIDYAYKAKNSVTGEVVKANVQAESEEAAAKLLVKQNLFPIEITPASKTNILARLGFSHHVSAKERVLFTRQLSTLINAGLPLVRALHTVQNQVKHQAFREVIAEVTADVEGGTSLSQAFAKHPKVFNEVYVSLVAAGETSGTLDKTLLRLANQQEKDAAVASKIRSALIYPAIVLVLILAVLVMMVVMVVPQVAKLYEDLDKDLPILTEVLIVISNFLTSFWWLNIIAIVVGYFVFRKLLATEKAHLELDRLKLRIPLFGMIYKKVYMARFARTMSALLASGVPMLQALETTRRAVANRVLQADMNVVIDKVRGGRALSEALDEAGHFLPLVSQMLKVGEESGAIADMMERVAIYYENEVDEAVKNLTTTLEPAMMVILGGLIALVLLATLYPVYSLVGSNAFSQ